MEFPDNSSSQSEPVKPRRFNLEKSVECIANLARKNPHKIELIPILEDLRKLLEIKKAGRWNDESNHDMKQYVRYALKRVYASMPDTPVKNSNSNPEEKLA